MTVESQIKTFRAKGVSDLEISKYYHQKLSGKVPAMEIEKWLTGHNLPSLLQQPDERTLVPEIPQPGAMQIGQPMSTNTGKPMLSAQEKIQMGADAMRTAGPIAGDIGLTAATGGSSLPFRAAASMIGTYGPAKLGEMMGGKSEMSADVETGLAGLMEAAPPLIKFPFKAAWKVAKPIIKYTGAMFGSKPIELALKKNQKLIRTQAADRTMKFLNDIAPDIVKKQDVDINDLAVKINASFKDAGAIYDMFGEYLERAEKENGGTLPTLDTVEELLFGIRESIKQTGEYALTRPKLNTETLKRFGYGSPETDSRSRFLERVFNGENLKAKDIKWFFENMNRNKGKNDFMSIPYSERGLRDQLKEAMLAEMSFYGGRYGADVTTLKRQADEMYKTTIRFKQVQKIIGKGLRKDKYTGKSYIMPNEIATQIYLAKGNIAEAMPELWPALKQFADHMQSIAPRFERIEADSAFDVIESIGILYPTQMATMKDLLYLTGVVAKPAAKTGMHLGGQKIQFTKPKPQLTIRQ